MKVATLIFKQEQDARNLKGIFMKKTRYTLDLQLFAGEGADSANGETGVENADAGQNSAAEGNADNEFAELISGRFKEQFAKKTQAIIDKRFKQTKELEAYKEKVSPLVERLMEQYGVSPGEEDKLAGFLDGKAAPPQPSAEEATRMDGLRGRIGSWIKQGEEMKEAFPDFDLRKEIRENKLFSQLLLGGAPLRAAYETVHRDEILSGAMAYTAGKVREQVVKGIEAKGRRPIENGVSSEGAVVTSVDVNSLTSQDILKILKQVENGASISF